MALVPAATVPHYLAIPASSFGIVLFIGTFRLLVLGRLYRT